jgi:polysaccharide biosynthesis transport protein
MLQTQRNAPQIHDELASEPQPDLPARFLGIIKRQFPIFIVFLCCSFLLGLLYLLTTPPRYTATSSVVIDTHKVQLLQQQSVVGENTQDAGTVQTEVEIIKSSRVLKPVIGQLHLDEDPEFVAEDNGLLATLTKFVFGASTTEKSQTTVSRQAMAALLHNLTVSRVGTTYVIDITFRSLDPEKAVRIANAIADGYISEQLEAKYQVTRRAGAWLQTRIKDLRGEVSSAERAVVDFKDKNNIVAAAGKLMNEQQLAEVNSQLILAHASTAEAKARFERIEEVMKEPLENASVADALKNEIIIKLRTQYLDLAARESIWRKKYGAEHLAVVNLRTQMEELRHNIQDEMKKIAESYKSDYEIASAREEAIKSSLANSVANTQITNQAQVQLSELESNANTYRHLYDNFLQRYTEAAQQESFPISEARIITPASRPFNKSEPKTFLVMLITAAGGLVFSFAVAALRETTDRVFRESKQIENFLQLNCLATLPIVRSDAAHDAAAAKGVAKSPAKIAGPRCVATDAPILRQAISSPLSHFTEALRSVKVAVDLNGILKSKKVIGFTSALPSEGKTTIATNFAKLVAHSGCRAVLVDADLRKPSLSRQLAPASTAGLVDVLAEKCSFADVQWVDPETGLVVIPTGMTSKIIHSSELLGSDRMKNLVDQLTQSFDYVLFDLPPLSPIVDVRMTTHFVDSYVFIVEWGRTRINVAERAIMGAREIQDRLLGVVMNKANLRVLGRYDSYHSRSQYQKYYSHYGYVE